MTIHESGHTKKQPDLQPGSIVGLLCFVSILVFAVLDICTGSGLQLLPIYLLLIVVVTWWGERQLAMMTVVFGMLGSFGGAFTMSYEVERGEAIANGCGSALTCLLISLSFSYLRKTKRNLEQQVAERAQLLQSEMMDRRATEEQLRKSLQQFRQFAENISDVFWIRNAGETRVGYASPAYEMVWGRSCKELYQSPQVWTEAIHEEDRKRVIAAMETKQMTGEYNEEYRVVRPDGSLRWIRDRSFPIRAVNGKVVRIVGVAEDVTDQRRLEREVLEISDREQGRIGQELHDSLCQKLVTLAFDEGRLENELASRSAPEVKTVQQMMELTDDLISESRAIARGLFPVQLNGDGLQNALAELAANVGGRFPIVCTLNCAHAEPVQDNAVATQLYRIAHEAVMNALKHSRGKQIEITLAVSATRIELSVADDGVGMPQKPNDGRGMGLHTMEYRARTIGAAISISNNTGGGTVVSCSASQHLT